MESVANPGPRLVVQPAACRATGGSRGWRVSWHVDNLNEEPLAILEAWAPHGQFRSPPRQLRPVLGIEPRRRASVELWVDCAEPRDTVVENAFLILRLQWRNRLWRVLARHSVRFDGNGSPQPICEVVTVQPLGFAHGDMGGTAEDRGRSHSG
jgi:hypothetical protein